MHIHRFFQPHHNPRLINVGVRQIELSELEQVATEMCKALERTQLRASRRQVAPIMPEHFTDIIKAMNFVRNSLQTLVDAHPGDEPSVLMDLYNEREELAGWEAWTSVLKEHFSGVRKQAVDESFEEDGNAAVGGNRISRRS